MKTKEKENVFQINWKKLIILLAGFVIGMVSIYFFFKKVGAF